MQPSVSITHGCIVIRMPLVIIAQPFVSITLPCVVQAAVTATLGKHYASLL